MDSTRDMTHGKPLQLLVSFALPLMFGNIFQQLYTVTDSAIVARGVGMEALAALGTTDWLNWMITGLALGFTQGCAVRISQKYGEGDIPGLQRVIAVSSVLSGVITLLLTAVSEVGLGLFLRLLQVPDELRGIAALYLRILFGGIPAIVFYNFCASVLRAVGDSKTPLKAMIVASVVNIVLDAVTVFGLGWGVAGAAAATVFSQLLSGILCAVCIARNPQLRFSAAQLHSPGAGELLRLGAPLALQNTIISIGGMAVQAIVNSFGLTFIAGFTATNKVYGILEMAAVAYGYAVTTYVGQNVGAGNRTRVCRGVRAALGLAVLTAVGIGSIMLLTGRWLTMLFITAEDAAAAAAAGEVAYRYLAAMSCGLPILYLLYVYRAALQGMGNTVMPLVSGGVEFLMRVGVAAAVAVIGRRNGIFAAEVAAWSGAALLLGICYYREIARSDSIPSFRDEAESS